MPFFLNMLQYALKFESVLFTFTIIYITFLFSLGPLPMSPHLLFLPSVSSFLHRIVFALSLSLHFFALSLYSTSLPPSLTKPRPEHQATPRHTNPTYTLRSPSTNTATRTRPTTSTTTHGLITMPRHAAEHVVPSTTSSKPPTIRFLLIGLQWWVFLLGLFDLGCGFVWFGCVFCRANLSGCVWCGFCFWVCLICRANLSVFFIFFLFFKVALVDVGLCQWWLSVLLRQWWLCCCCCWWRWGW